MRKKLTNPARPQPDTHDPAWLDLENLADVEMTSEDVAWPVENALLPGNSSGWRAAEPGEQIIRLLFASPQALRRIQLQFEESNTERTQEFCLRWSADNGQTFQEIVRQQWNFNPQDANTEIEDLQVELPAVSVLELAIRPDISGGPAIASLAALRLA